MKATVLLATFFYGTTAFVQPIHVSDSMKVNEIKEVSIMGSNPHKTQGSGELITATTLLKMNQLDVNKVLRIIPGVNVRDEEGFGLRPNIGLRGTPVNRSSKITLMEDGVLIAPAPYADPAAYYFPTFARMQGIEVLKGSSQIKYGPYTIGGAVNLLSTAIPTSFKGMAQVGYGSFGTNQQRIWLGDSHNSIDYVFDVNRIASNGFKQIDGGGNTGFDRRDVMGKIRWRSASSAKIKQSLTVKFVNSEEIGNETYLGLTYSDYQANPVRRYAGTQKDLLTMRHSHFTISHTAQLAKEISIQTTAYHSTTFRDWARANSFGGQSIAGILADPTTNSLGYGIMTGKLDGTVNYRSAARTYYSQGIQTNVHYNFRTKNNFFHKLQAGVRFHKDQADRYGTSDTYSMVNGILTLTAAGVKGNQENQIRNAQSTAIYLNYELAYRRFKFIPGMRMEQIRFEFLNFGTADLSRIGSNLKSASNALTVFLPGVSVSYDLNEKSHLFAGVHKGFSPPGMPSTTSGSVQATAESAINYEVGFRYSRRDFKLQAAGFLNDYSNILGSDNLSGGGAGTGDMFNAGRALVQGIEFSMDYSFSIFKKKFPGLLVPLRMAYTFTDARFQETFTNGGGDWGSGMIYAGDKIPFITPHMATASIGIENKKISVSFVARYISKTRTIPGQAQTILPVSDENYASVNALDAFLLLDCSINYTLNKRWVFYALINNITNNKAIVANLPQGYRPSMPFGANIGVKINL